MTPRKSPHIETANTYKNFLDNIHGEVDYEKLTTMVKEHNEKVSRAELKLIFPDVIKRLKEKGVKIKRTSTSQFHTELYEAPGNLENMEDMQQRIFLELLLIIGNEREIEYNLIAEYKEVFETEHKTKINLAELLDNFGYDEITVLHDTSSIAAITNGNISDTLSE